MYCVSFNFSNEILTEEIEVSKKCVLEKNQQVSCNC